MFSKRSLPGIGVATTLSLMLACVPSGQPTVSQAPGGQTANNERVDRSGDSQQRQNTNTNNNATNGGTAPQTVVTPPDTFTPPPETTVQERYPNWVKPSDEQMNDGRYAKIYNYTNDGISSVNGRTLPQTVPPGEVALVPKESRDIDHVSGRYKVTVTTDTGKTGTGNFNADNVNMANWRASVSDNGGTLTIQENAGGGGGDGGGGEDNFDGF